MTESVEKTHKQKAVNVEHDTVNSSTEAAKILADFGKESLKFGKSDEAITRADQQSTTEYLETLRETLQAINKEIEQCTSSDEKSLLYKQRENILHRMQEEKENQRIYHEQREEKDRTHAKGIFASVAMVALGAGAVAVKFLADSKKS